MYKIWPKKKHAEIIGRIMNHNDMLTETVGSFC